MAAASWTAAIVAVDGGNSKTDVAIVDESGHVLAALRGPSSSHQVVGLEGGMLVLDGLAREAACRAGVPSAGSMPTPGGGSATTAGDPIARLGVYCLAGADFPSDLRILQKGLQRARISETSVVFNDGFAGLRAGSSKRWGVAVIMGHGINVAAIAPDGRSLIHAPGDPTSGDWGGGHAVGQRALSAAVRARDGRGPRTILERTVPGYFGLSRPLDLTRAVYEDRIDDDRLDELTPVVFDAATQGDQVARGIIDWIADEAVLIARSAVRKLRMSQLEVDVVLSGGVFRTTDQVFHERIRTGILAFAPRARVTPLSAPPVMGAALLAMDRLDIRDRSAAEQRLRSELTYERLTDPSVAV
jgi:N-acetylglucosamine kinase-like BadF-type ATPase